MLFPVFWYRSGSGKNEALAFQIFFNLEDLVGMQDQDRLAGITVKAQINVVNIDIACFERKKKLVQIADLIFQFYADHIIGTAEIAAILQRCESLFCIRYDQTHDPVFRPVVGNGTENIDIGILEDLGDILKGSLFIFSENSNLF